jgi:hypothetical protein
MNIVYKKQCEAYKLLILGDVFSWAGIMYMKTQNFLSESGGELYNAVNLSLGKGAYFNDNDEVTLVKAQLVVS